mmetsp:Transcript_11591/g.25535  ORF Transcript_11591/g.25535 Transcript_11591/m.25535 type:complete len:272 (-) Transcript_11591:377-1192(-)
MTNIGSLGIGRHHNLNRTGTFIHLGTIFCSFLHFHRIHLSSTVGQHGIHPIGPNSWNGLTYQYLDTSRNQPRRTHGINLLQIPFQMSGSRLLLRNPRTRFCRVWEGRTSLPKHGGAPSSSNGVECKEDATTIGKTASTAATTKKFCPDRSSTSVRSLVAPHCQTIVQETSVRCDLLLRHIAEILRKEGRVFLTSPRFVNEPRGDNTRVVTSFEGVGLLSGTRVSVEVFLKRPSVLKPILHLIRRSFRHQLGSLLQIIKQVLHVGGWTILGD